MPQIAIRCCPMIWQYSANPHGASQFMHHRAGKFIFKGNLPAGKGAADGGGLNAEVSGARLPISASGASPRFIRRHLRQHRHAPTGLFNCIHRMRHRVRTTLIRCIKPMGNAVRSFADLTENQWPQLGSTTRRPRKARVLDEKSYPARVCWRASTPTSAHRKIRDDDLIKVNLPGQMCLASRRGSSPCQPIEWLFRLSSLPASAKRVTPAVQSPYGYQWLWPRPQRPATRP